jgi:hypothetical protein
LPAASLASLIDRVQTVSEGNPFVVTQMMRALPLEGLAGVVEGLGLPDTVREMILDRVRLVRRGSGGRPRRPGAGPRAPARGRPGDHAGAGVPGHRGRVTLRVGDIVCPSR